MVHTFVDEAMLPALGFVGNAARIEDLGQGDFVKVDCAACGHTALLTPEFLTRLGPKASRRVL